MPGLLAVSACLIGRSCRYDGAAKPSAPVIDAVRRWREQGEVALVCPEELGGLGTPRPGATLSGGDGAAALDGAARVRRNHDGGDVTAQFLAGAAEAGRLVEGAEAAILKARSPSCGCGQTSIDGRPQVGDGVFAALLRRRGVALITDEEHDALFRLARPIETEHPKIG